MRELAPDEGGDLFDALLTALRDAIHERDERAEARRRLRAALLSDDDHAVIAAYAPVLDRDPELTEEERRRVSLARRTVDQENTFLSAMRQIVVDPSVHEDFLEIPWGKPEKWQIKDLLLGREYPFCSRVSPELQSLIPTYAGDDTGNRPDRSELHDAHCVDGEYIAPSENSPIWALRVGAYLVLFRQLDEEWRPRHLASLRGCTVLRVLIVDRLLREDAGRRTSRSGGRDTGTDRDLDSRRRQFLALARRASRATDARFAEIIKEAFALAGAEIVVGESSVPGVRAHFAVWLEELEPIVGNPLLVQVRRTVALSSLRLIAETGRATWPSVLPCLLVVYRAGPSSADFSWFTTAGTLFIPGEELLESLANTRLGGLLLSLRNLAAINSGS